MSFKINSIGAFVCGILSSKTPVQAVGNAALKTFFSKQRKPSAVEAI